MSVDCVILQFTSDTDNIIIVSLMSPWLALVQPFCLISIFFLLSDAPFAYLRPLYHSDTSTTGCCLILCRVKSKLWGLGTITSLCLNLVGVFIFKVLLFFLLGVSTANITQASDRHACDLTPLAANVFSGAEPAWFRGWKFQSPLYHFPYHYSIHSHFSLHPESREGVEWLKRRASCTRRPTLI